jgi:hypothetical protein
MIVTESYLQKRIEVLDFYMSLNFISQILLFAHLWKILSLSSNQN